jgi:hypothetical protein
MHAVVVWRTEGAIPADAHISGVYFRGDGVGFVVSYQLADGTAKTMPMVSVPDGDAPDDEVK